MAKLAQVEVNRTDIPPHETITYSKVTQTSEPGMEELYSKSWQQAIFANSVSATRKCWILFPLCCSTEVRLW